ncbi:DUF3618 domain-containing protein [Streptomyces canus]|jgi:hypothetical protein|uniref:DUF3618 domain-containing protein n=1 Tax=Streptomyces canus TaxID=58343 RepID=UPI0033A018E7
MTDRTSGEPPATGAKGPDELRRQIERTRSELGDTVEELAGKMDVKGRARARAADLRDKAGAMTVQLRSSAAQAGHTVHDRATHAGHKVQDKAVKSGHKVQDRTLQAGHVTQGKASQTSAALERRAERSVPQPARPLVLAAVRHPRPALIVGAALAAVVVVSWRYPKK